MIDIGCGSGLHSLAALRAGVQELYSFCYDPASTSTTRELYRREGSPENWQVKQGSILDPAYVATLGKFDIVYSWGVLHHTGNLWLAFESAAALVAPGGVFYVALYDSEVAHPSPEFWLSIKQRYNRGGWITKRSLEAWQVRDWLGGWPMEYSTVDQVTSAAADLGLERVKLTTGEACAEYLFIRPE